MEGLEFGLSASGWLMQWQLGVVHALQRHSIGKAKDAKFIGSSGGAACSAALALDIDARLLADFMTRCCSDYHKDKFRKMFQMREYCKACIERTMEEDTFNHEALQSGKLNVVVTLVPSMKRVVVNQFNSNQEYLEACLASCTATPFAGTPLQLNSSNPELNGKYALDGGATDMMPVLSKKTIRITPLYCLDAEIKPSRYVPIHYGLFPPDVNEFKELFWLGAKDGMTWLHQNGYGSFKLEKKRFDLHFENKQKQEKIKPLAKKSKVTVHSSHNVSVTRLNPHSYDLETYEARDKVETSCNYNIELIHRNRSNSINSDDSFNTIKVQNMIASDSLKCGLPMTKLSEGKHKIQDSMTAALLVASVKPVALGVVYSELATKAAFSAVTGLYAAIETKRRESVPQREGILSLRKWVHDGMIGNAQESLDMAKAYFFSAVNPNFWISHLPLSTNLPSEDLIQDLVEKSFSYRLFTRASLW